MKRGILAVILAAALAVPAWADLRDLREGVAAHDRGDYKTAFRHYLRSAQQGSVDAQFLLGGLYFLGQGVQEDNTEAARWFRMAAEQGHASAQYSLGVMYTTAGGVPQDYVQAHMWLNLAWARMSGAEKADAAKWRDRVAAWMSPAMVAEAQRLAREWKPR
jgi:TPR repeat protein